MAPRATIPFQRVIDSFETQIEAIVSVGRDAQENETLEMLDAAIRRFAERHIDEARFDQQSQIPQEVIQAAAHMGLFGISIDPQYGGAGLSMKGCCRVIDRLGREDRSVGVSIGLHAGLGLRGLNYLGTFAQKQKFLPKLAKGEQIACFSITEADAGSDIASMRTTAIRDGDSLVLNGSKVYVTNGGFASLATIVARTPGLNGSKRGHSMLLVPLDSQGVERGVAEHKLGIRGSSTCSLHFDNVRIPIDNILGKPSMGLDHMNHVLTWGRTLMASGCIGLSKAALARTLDQVTQRRQFNRMIAEFGMVQEKLASMRSRLFAMESLIRLVTQLEDQTPDSITWESSVAKIFCTESAWTAVDDALQLHGGSGFIEDVGIARLLRDCRICRIFEGANELLRFHMASAAFVWKIKDWTCSLSAKMDGLLASLSQAFDDLLQRFAQMLRVEKKKHGLKVFRQQMVQHRVADIALDLYTLLAILTRAKGEQQVGNLSDDLLLWTQHAGWELTHRIENNLNAQHDNPDDWAKMIALSECARIGFPLEETVA